MKTLYFDYNATSPMRPEVRRALRPFLEELFGNPSSLHAPGRKVRAAVEAVRSRVLEALGDSQGELLFTSGGTEANNLALKGVVRNRQPKGNHVIVSSVEHQAVLNTVQALQREGARVTWIPVNREGVVDLEFIRDAFTPQTVLVSVMQANNEVGTIQPIEEIGKMARSRGVLFHTDAVQSFTKAPLDLRTLAVDMVSLSGHKLGGIKGAGALYLRRGVSLQPLLHGGPHEHNLRAGTEAVPGIVGLGAALEVCLEEQRNGTLTRIRLLRDCLEQGLRKEIPDLELNGHSQERLQGTLNLSFLGCDGETLLAALDLEGICVSTGSACSSGSTEPSHVLVAMGLESERIAGSIRFSLGWATTEEEVEQARKQIPPVVERVRKSKSEVSR